MALLLPLLLASASTTSQASPYRQQVSELRAAVRGFVSQARDLGFRRPLLTGDGRAIVHLVGVQQRDPFTAFRLERPGVEPEPEALRAFVARLGDRCGAYVLEQDDAWTLMPLGGCGGLETGVPRPLLPPFDGPGSGVGPAPSADGGAGAPPAAGDDAPEVVGGLEVLPHGLRVAANLETTPVDGAQLAAWRAELSRRVGHPVPILVRGAGAGGLPVGAKRGGRVLLVGREQVLPPTAGPCFLVVDGAGAVGWNAAEVGACSDEVRNAPWARARRAVPAVAASAAVEVAVGMVALAARFGPAEGDGWGVGPGAGLALSAAGAFGGALAGVAASGPGAERTASLSIPVAAVSFAAVGLATLTGDFARGRSRERDFVARTLSYSVITVAVPVTVGIGASRRVR